MSNEVAPDGQVFVCAACGRQSKDRHGEQKRCGTWDSSCVSNSVLCYDDPEAAAGRAQWKPVKAIKAQPLVRD